MGKYNVILLTIDCLRADHLDCYGYRKQTAPNIARLADRGVLFMDVFSAGPYTKASFKTILTGLYPFTKGGYHTIEHLVTLPEFFKKLNYKTYAIPNNVLLNRESGYSKGFDVYIDPIRKYSEHKELLRRMGGARILRLLDKIAPKLAERIRIHFVENPYLKAKDVVSLMIKCIIDAGRKPFFIWAHFMDTHFPYTYLPKIYFSINGEKIEKAKLIKINRSIERYIRFNENLKSELIAKIIKLYDAEIRYIDICLGKLIGFLDKISLLDSTIIVITADHGEEFMEHGAFGHSGEKNISHLYQELLRVPLIIYHPNYASYIVKNSVSSADIVPTILNEIGMSTNSFDGMRILSRDVPKNRILISEASLYNYRRGVLKIGPSEKISMAVRIGNWKYIYYESRNIKNELYDLSRDSHEKNNVIDRYVDLAKIIYNNIVKKRLRKIKRDLIKYSIIQ